jgi:hypothetical protein
METKTKSVSEKSWIDIEQQLSREFEKLETHPPVLAFSLIKSTDISAVDRIGLYICGFADEPEIWAA